MITIFLPLRRRYKSVLTIPLTFRLLVCISHVDIRYCWLGTGTYCAVVCCVTVHYYYYFVDASLRSRREQDEHIVLDGVCMREVRAVVTSE